MINCSYDAVMCNSKAPIVIPAEMQVSSFCKYEKIDLKINQNLFIQQASCSRYPVGPSSLSDKIAAVKNVVTHALSGGMFID